MDCSKLAAFYDEYALGVLEGEDLAELKAHVARACPNCARGVEKARWVVAQLALASPQVDPPASLRAKILRQASASSIAPIRPAQSKAPLFPAWAWAAAIALALITGYAVRQVGIETTQLADLRKQMRFAQLQNQSLQVQLELNRQVASVMISPDSKALLLAAKDPKVPAIHAYLHPHMGVAFTADTLPEVPTSRTMQLWVVPKKGMPVSIAIFRPDMQGQVVMLAPVNVEMNQIAALAVTDEPAGGSPQPTTMPAWVAAMR
jgi:anti-sigma-K factor RskA